MGERPLDVDLSPGTLISKHAGDSLMALRKGGTTVGNMQCEKSMVGCNFVDFSEWQLTLPTDGESLSDMTAKLPPGGIL